MKSEQNAATSTHQLVRKVSQQDSDEAWAVINMHGAVLLNMYLSRESARQRKRELQEAGFDCRVVRIDVYVTQIEDMVV